MVVLSAHLTVFAVDDMYLQEVLGHVVSNQDGYVQIVGESLTIPGMMGTFTLYAGEASLYDLLNGYPAHVDALPEGATVRAVYTPDYYAHTVWFNLGAEGSAAFKAMVSDNIYYGEEGCVFLTDDGKYRVTVSPETRVIDPYYGQMAAHDIRPGYEMFIWVDMVTASFPAQVFPEKVVFVY
jgi:hypothetical protein